MVLEFVILTSSQVRLMLFLWNHTERTTDISVLLDPLVPNEAHHLAPNKLFF